MHIFYIGERLNIHEKTFSKIGINYIILTITTILVQILLVNIINIFNPLLLQNNTIITLITSLSSYILPLPVFIYLMGKLKSEKIIKKRLNVKKFFKYLCISITFMWIGNIIGVIITFLIGTLISSEIVNPINQLIQNSSIYVNILIISFLAPIFEEIFFRKLLIDRTIQYGAKISILLSALLFALFHGNLSQFFYAFLIGGLFAYIYIKTGRIIYTILLHMIINLSGSVVNVLFNQSLQNIQTGALIIPDVIIVAVYFVFIITCLTVGISAVLDYKNIKLESTTPEIILERPVKTVLLNTGMIIFIIYYLIKIIMSLGIISF